MKHQLQGKRMIHNIFNIVNVDANIDLRPYDPLIPFN